MADRTIYDLLHEDHLGIQAALDRLDRTIDQPRGRRELLLELEELLVAHSRAEEDVFYCALRQHQETEQIANAGNEEHGGAARLVAELRERRVEEARWGEKFLELKHSLEQHFDEEEHERFEQARRVLSDEEALELGRRFLTRRSAAATA